MRNAIFMAGQFRNPYTFLRESLEFGLTSCREAFQGSVLVQVDQSLVGRRDPQHLAEICYLFDPTGFDEFGELSVLPTAESQHVEIV